ncbi:uncharacterized protein LOC107632779 [Arachis ipaensis]|uniref:uncharacterized protein LOC107632779 n=1 Tax=Arachis ipaensis TaxID=130454 RepID=UPI0007AF6AB2|nr:uncharacterized protein LOC107632779 [Arachis ipaensis]
MVNNCQDVMTICKKYGYPDLIITMTYSGGFYFFFYGHDRCGKTFICNGLSSVIRSRAKIVLNVASSGIASLLIPGGRTAHSRFLIPITITDESTYNIKHDQHEGEMKRLTNWILDVRNKNIGSVVGDESEVEISDDLLITTSDDPLSHLVDFAYPNLLQNMSDYRYF